jgi:hypothetical protein
MNNKDFVVNTLKQIGFKVAQELQSNIPDMEATDIIEQEEYLPRFDNTKQYLNFNVGYTCFSAKGNAVRLLQPYDSLTYPQEPEELGVFIGLLTQRKQNLMLRVQKALITKETVA